MKKALKIYITALAAATFLGYWFLTGNQELLVGYASISKILGPAVAAPFGALIVYTLEQIKAIKAIDGLRSKERTQVATFSALCQSRLFKMFLFHSLVAVAGLLIGNISWTFSNELLFGMSVYTGLVVVALLSYLSVYNLLTSIELFESFILIRVEKVKEKEKAMALLSAEENFDSSDLSYFQKQRNVHKP
ncbi:hypothetical protein L1D52_09895 [Vibrio brasiliensis]|uniref:hypothetical protein n=1 Tax=Vibrio brasiliensis TaxID=170652 RepID=UPI001EFC982F|nr:hypothetical protein [Vibrio brasiliensis]MCG9782667.1 hypothetical protein [Vibrio brasiliensis]